MTTKEAIQAMLDGEKVVPSGWSGGVYIMFNGTHFVREDGNQFLFGSLEYDWEIYGEPKPKQVIVIKKWLCEYCGGYVAVEGNDLSFMMNELFKKVKLLDTYEVEL